MEFKNLKLLCFFFMSLSLCSMSYAAIHPIPQVEVLMAQSIKKITLKGKNLQKTSRTIDSKDDQQASKNQKEKFLTQDKFYPGDHKLTLDCLKKILPQTSLHSLGASENSVYMATLSSNHGPIQWDHQHYQGKINIIRQSNQTGCDLVQSLSLENYLTTLLGKEMHRDWPIEALKAQAVAARSYALFKIDQRKTLAKMSKPQSYDLINSEVDQVNGSLQDVTSQTVKATYFTQGEVLVDDQEQISPAFYHARCGGHTFLPEQIWKESKPGFSQKTCKYCVQNAPPQWNYRFSAHLIAPVLCRATLLNENDEEQCDHLINLNGLQIYHHSPSSYKITYYFRGRKGEISKAKLRSILGRKRIPSHHFTVSMEQDALTLRGTGLGHGVGMCQYGAYQMAKEGKNYKEILSFYYPGLVLKKLY